MAASRSPKMKRRNSLNSDSSNGRKPLEWLESVATELDQLGCDWVVAGAAAAADYRLAPRFTSDLDLLVTWLPELPSRFEKAGYTVREIAAPSEQPHLIVLTRGDERIDLLVATVEYQELAIARGRTQHVLTVEDVIVHKLIAWRARDRDDIASILAAGHDLDVGYIDLWAEKWDVYDRWEPVRPR